MKRSGEEREGRVGKKISVVVLVVVVLLWTCGGSGSLSPLAPLSL